MRAIGSMCLSAQIPASPGVILPSYETAVASPITKLAPPTAREPRCTKCQSVATPSSDEYWHMGETPMRLRSVTDLMVSGENKWGEFSLSLFIRKHFITASKEDKKYLD
jgi:hypothetical protein